MDQTTLHEAVDGLRELLRTERRRLRPDAWEQAWRITEATAQLLPQWTRLQRERGGDSLVVEDIVLRYLPQSLEAFLEIPDAGKPAAAAELSAQLDLYAGAHRKALRRLHGTQRNRLEALGDVARMRFDDGADGPG